MRSSPPGFWCSSSARLAHSRYCEGAAVSVRAHIECGSTHCPVWLLLRDGSSCLPSRTFKRFCSAWSPFCSGSSCSACGPGAHSAGRFPWPRFDMTRALVSVLAWGLSWGASPGVIVTRRAALHHAAASRMSMACLYSIEAYAAADEQTIGKALDAALDEVDRIDRLMSHYKPESPLSTINREAAHHPVAVDPELFAFIKRSMEYSQQSGGAFDITVGPLMKAWGFFRGDGHLATPDEVTAARARVGAHHVLLDATARTIR